jgi:capsular exopolysaccharide synthesis family protein
MMSKLTQLQTARPAQLSRPAESRIDDMASDDDGWLTFADILRIVSIHWRRISAAGLILGGVCAIAVLFMPTVYSGTALVMIDEQQNHIFDSRTDPSVLSDLPSDPSSIESQVQMLESHALIGRVVDRLGLANDPEFNGARQGWFGFVVGAGPAGVARAADGLERQLGPGSKPEQQEMASTVRARSAGGPGMSDSAQQRREVAIGSVKENLNAQIEGRSTVIGITFRSRSAIKAALTANAIADSYVDSLTGAKSAASEGAAKWLADKVTKLGRQAGAADAAVQLYKAQNGLLDTSTGTALTDRKLGDLTGQLITAEGDRAEAQAKLARVKQLVRSGKNADVTEVVDSPLIAQLREQEATLLQQKADFSSRYGDRNPKMVSLETQLNVLKQKIDEEAARIVGTVSNSVAVADAHVQAIRGEMAGATSTANTQNYARVKLGELAADAASAHALYQTYLDRLKQTQEQTGLKSTDAHVASPASVPLAPISPKSALIIGGGTFGGLLLGFLFAIMADRMCNGFRSLQELESVTGLPVLATLPELTSKRPQDAALEVICRPHSEFSEAVRALEISLARSYLGGREAKVFAVMSAVPGEGKTVTAVSVARRFAIYGKRVVLVDGDLRRPNVSLTLGVNNTRYDLGDYLSRRCLLDEAICADPHSSLVALPVSRGLKVSNEANISAMAALIQHLRGISDIVLIDTPPVLAVQDARLLAELSDGALFVIRWAKTSREAVLRALKLLRDFGIPLVGTTLVRAHAKYHRFYSYGHTGLPALVHYYES